MRYRREWTKFTTSRWIHLEFKDVCISRWSPRRKSLWISWIYQLYQWTTQDSKRNVAVIGTPGLLSSCVPMITDQNPFIHLDNSGSSLQISTAVYWWWEMRSTETLLRVSIFLGLKKTCLAFIPLYHFCQKKRKEVKGRHPHHRYCFYCRRYSQIVVFVICVSPSCPSYLFCFFGGLGLSSYHSHCQKFLLPTLSRFCPDASWKKISARIDSNMWVKKILHL